MNSKVLQESEKVKGINSHPLEMRLLRKDASREDHQVVSSDGCQSSVSLKHYDQLLCDLKCPGCSKRLQSPIYLCASGHSVCRLCKFSLSACAICNKEMTEMRSHTLERLSVKFQFPCKNLRNGCNVRLPMELMKWHEEKCVYKKTSCFMGKVWHDCHWVGREDEWLNHCKEKHEQKILQNQEQFELIWNSNSLCNNAGPVLAYYLILNFSETFNFYQIHDAKTSTLTWTVMLADYKETKFDKELHSELPKFWFEIEFYRKDDTRFLHKQRYPVHYADSETLLDDGKCVKIFMKDLHNFFDDEKNLFYKVRINSCKLQKDRWDVLLGKAKNKLKGSSQDAKFQFFDSLESEPYIHTDEDFSSSFESHEPQRDKDLLKHIFNREFSVNDHQPSEVQVPLLPHAPYPYKSPRNATKF